jgi:two-component sensor histidine kinase
MTIQLKQSHDHHFLLIISDNGIGLPNNFDLFSTNSLGINLMRGSCDQLQAEFSLEKMNGTHLNFEFIRSENIGPENLVS